MHRYSATSGAELAWDLWLDDFPGAYERRVRRWPHDLSGIPRAVKLPLTFRPLAKDVKAELALAEKIRNDPFCGSWPFTVSLRGEHATPGLTTTAWLQPPKPEKAATEKPTRRVKRCVATR